MQANVSDGGPINQKRWLKRAAVVILIWHAFIAVEFGFVAVVLTPLSFLFNDDPRVTTLGSLLFSLVVKLEAPYLIAGPVMFFVSLFLYKKSKIKSSLVVSSAVVLVVVVLVTVRSLIAHNML